MTTRGLMRRRFFRSLLAFAAWMIVLGVWHENVPRNHALDLMIGPLAALGFVAVEAYWWLTPCTACHRTIGWRACIWRLWGGRPRACPHCGVSIDK